jgi:hypothetical protein
VEWQWKWVRLREWKVAVDVVTTAVAVTAKPSVTPDVVK